MRKRRKPIAAWRIRDAKQIFSENRALSDAVLDAGVLAALAPQDHVADVLLNRLEIGVAIIMSRPTGAAKW